MSREILFKGRTKDGGNWVYGDLIHRCCGTTIGTVDSDGLHEVYVDEEIICQYTGLTDKNGKKIWENDFLRYRHNFYKVRWDDKFSRFVADEYTKYNGKYVVLDIHGFNCFKEIIDKFFEVIGNIFDNPELLKEGAEE